MAPRVEGSSLPGLNKYPTFRDDPLKSGEVWLQGKRVDDDTDGLWRVHDGLYDLSDWLHKHPGGAEWLRMTKGTDITEAFEAHHVGPTAERLLPKFLVREVATPRNSPYTFRDDGFYRTLKRRARDVLRGSRGPARASALIADGLLTGALACAVMAARTGSLLLGAMSGVLLAGTTICAHNFFHQRDNVRMYYFDLSFMSSRDWRISHALSHHIYPNSLLDLEVSMFEPVLQWLPHGGKSLWVRYGAWLWSPLVYSVMFHAQLVLRLALVLKGRVDSFRKQDAIPLIVPVVMYLLGGSTGIVDVVRMWTWVILVSSFVFGAVGLNGGHHHPDVFHDGDKPREDRDWGISQLDAVRDRKEISRNLFLVLTNFGHHSLHHLFPTVDHSRLPALYPVLEETCREFGIDYKTETVWEMLKGQFLQLARTSPNPVAPGAGKKRD